MVVDHNIIGAVEFAALPTVGQHGDCAVGFEARHPAGLVFTHEQAALVIVGRAIGHVRRVAQGFHFAARRMPPVNAARRNVRKGHVALSRMPGGAFGELETVAQRLEGLGLVNQRAEALVENEKVCHGPMYGE